MPRVDRWNNKFEKFIRRRKEKKCIVVPQELNGRKVVMLGYRNAMFSPGAGCWESDNLQKLFVIGTDYMVIKNVFAKCPNLEKIIFQSDDNHNNGQFTIGVYEKDPIVFINPSQYFKGNTQYDENSKPSAYSTNTSFYYNYEDAPNNGYYWIDDVEDGELIDFIPEEPTREGYKFGGWYKEEECINKWDFAIDTVKKASAEEPYYENKLFAQWVKE